MADEGGYFLLPLDANCSERIPIPDGETTLGRGPFLKITDKRVSRSHATLTNKGGRLSLCLKHTNPCFYKAAGSTTYTQLQKDEEQVLSRGDCFSFLPNSLRFELQRVPAVTTEVDGRTACAAGAAHEEIQDGKEEDEVGPSEEVKLSSPSEEERRAPEADTDTRQKVVDTHLIDLTHQADVDIYQADVDKHQADVDIHQADVDIHQADVDIHQADSESCLKSLDTSVTTEREGKSDNTVESDSSAVVVGCLGKKRRLPGWLSMGSMDGKREEDARGSKKRAAKGKTPAVASKPPAKRRARISSDEEGKKSLPTKKRSRKKASSEAPHVLDATEDKDDEDFSEQVPRATKSPPTHKSPPSAAKSPPSAAKSPPSAAKSPLPTDKSLPLCPYGKSCYRKKPAHFREYSHPQGDSSKEGEDSDSLSDADGWPECPYGTACYRRNTLHRQQYKHSAAPAVERLPRSSRAKRKRIVTTRKGRSTACDGDSDDDGLPNTYDYDDSFIDDDDGANSSTSSGGDDSDEDWQHPGGGGGEESEEDIQELAKEANEFVSNPKLHRR